MLLIYKEVLTYSRIGVLTDLRPLRLRSRVKELLSSLCISDIKECLQNSSKLANL